MTTSFPPQAYCPTTTVASTPPPANRQPSGNVASRPSMRLSRSSCPAGMARPVSESAGAGAAAAKLATSSQRLTSHDQRRMDLSGNMRKIEASL